MLSNETEVVLLWQDTASEDVKTPRKIAESAVRRIGLLCLVS